MQTIQYLDGIGRPMQIILVENSPYKNDISQPIGYDEFGRQRFEYLPFKAKKNFTVFDKDWKVNLDDFYVNPGTEIASTGDPYSEKDFDNSPLNRVTKQGAPGTLWQLNNAAIIYNYKSNVSNEVRIWTYNDVSMIASSTSYYPAGKLHIVETIDENGNKTTEYKNFEDQVILKTSYNGAEVLSTYYVYDDYGNLGCVIPPKAYAQMTSVVYNTSSLTEDLVYTYKYDDRQRMTHKKIPGQEVMYLVYNDRDLLVLTQDGNMREDKHWMYTKYDVHSRPIISGIYYDNIKITQLEMQDYVNGYMYLDEYFVPASKSYYNRAFPTTGIIEVLNYNYYDTYDFIPSGKTYLSTNPSDADFTSNVKLTGPLGLQTGAKIKKLGTNDYLYVSTYYDKFDRVIQTVNDNAKGGYDIIYNKYDFIGKIEIALLSHYNGSTTQTMKWWYEYDHAERLLNVKHQINSQAQQWIVKNEYNELGQLIEKDLHAFTPTSTGSDFWQSVDYRYNIRGWLTSINSSNLATSTQNPDDYKADLFGMELTFEAGLSNLSGTAAYNGNISGMKWKVSGGSERGYGFQYDDVNRLTKAKYGEGSSFTSNIDRYSVGGTSASTDIDYDENGNIEKLWRKGYKTSSFGEIDKLTYTYSGNRLTAVNDAIADIGNNDFKDGSSSGSNEYSYDVNGNMKSDANKGIVDITYNYLNLPQEIDFGGGEKIIYIYTANGVKLEKQVYTNSSLTHTKTYAGSFVYSDNVLEYVLFDEGRLVDNSGTFKYEYFLKDHLGNTRVTFSNDNNDSNIELEQQDHYYPFGMNFAGVGGTSANPVNKYKYNGKELQDDHNLNWYDYGARFYDVQIGRWHVIDPLSEKYYNRTPFNYGLNRPLSVIDPDGKEPRELEGYSGFSIGPYGNISFFGRQSSGEEEDESENKDKSKQSNNGNLHSVSVAFSQAMLDLLRIKGVMFSVGYIWGNNDGSFYITIADLNGVDYSFDLSYTEYLNLLDRNLVVNDAMGNGGVINLGVPSSLPVIGANLGMSYADNTSTNYEPSSYFAVTAGGAVGIPISVSEGNSFSRRVSLKEALLMTAAFITTIF